MPKSFDMLPQSVVVTGASRGLGAALAMHYARSGTSLGLLARSEADLQALARDCRAKGSSVAVAVADVTDREALTEALLRLDDAAPVDLLYVNAGIEFGPEPGEAMEWPARFARVIDVNLTAAGVTAAVLLPRMLARRRGRVAFIASVAALGGLPDSPAYCASKAGLRILADSLRPRLAADGVGVSLIMPGFFESAMSDRWIGDKSDIVSVEKMAAQIAVAVARGRARVAIPWRLGLSMRLLGMLPTRWADRLVLRSRFQIDNSG